jgi:hypothetical protein
MNAAGLRRLAGRLVAGVREMNEAQHRMLILGTAMDRYLVRPDLPPDTYAEFLGRTSGVLTREPPARDRQAPGPSRH